MRFMISCYHSLLIKYQRLIIKYHKLIKKQENKFTDNIRPRVSSRLQSINKVSEIDNKISHAKLIKKLFNTSIM